MCDENDNVLSRVMSSNYCRPYSPVGDTKGQTVARTSLSAKRLTTNLVVFRGFVVVTLKGNVFCLTHRLSLFLLRLRSVCVYRDYDYSVTS